MPAMDLKREAKQLSFPRLAAPERTGSDPPEAAGPIATQASRHADW